MDIYHLVLIIEFLKGVLCYERGGGGGFEGSY